MDSFIYYLFLLIAALVVALLIAWIGFRLPAPAKPPERQSIPRPDPIPLPKSLPAPLHHFYEKNFGSLIYPPANSLAWGRGRIIARRFPTLGPLWVPISWTLDLIPGESFVMHNRITWFRRTFIRGGEEFRQEKGKFIVGGKSVESEHIDRSEQTMLWLYTLILTPTTLLLDPRVNWRMGEGNTVCIEIPFSEGENREFVIHFNPESWQITRITTERSASRDGRLIPYQFVVKTQRSFEGDLTLPSLINGVWEDDAYIQYEILGTHYNVEMDEVMAEGVS